jgi:dUTP pyrophosphatase
MGSREVKARIICDNPELMPVYASEGAAGMDLKAAARCFLFPGDHVPVPTGVSLEIPTGYEAQIRPRSGLAAKEGITVLNAPGTIDSDYRGEIKVILINHSKKTKLIEIGDRIAQMVFAKHERISLEPTLELTETKRGRKGFGSTGS